jgi:hypothetical protein
MFGEVARHEMAAIDEGLALFLGLRSDFFQSVKNLLRRSGSGMYRNACR